MPVDLVGPIVRVSPNAVAIANIEDLKTVYTIKETYRKSEFYQLMTGGSQSVFGTTNVERHRKLRRLLAAQMSETSLKSMLPQISSHVDLAIRKMKKEAEARGVIDVYKWCAFLTTDVVGELSFGESFHMLERGKVGRAPPRTSFCSLSSSRPHSIRLNKLDADMLQIRKTNTSKMWRTSRS